MSLDRSRPVLPTPAIARQPNVRSFRAFDSGTWSRRKFALRLRSSTHTHYGPTLGIENSAQTTCIVIVRRLRVVRTSRKKRSVSPLETSGPKSSDPFPCRLYETAFVRQEFCRPNRIQLAFGPNRVFYSTRDPRVSTALGPRMSVIDLSTALSHSVSKRRPPGKNSSSSNVKIIAVKGACACYRV